MSERITKELVILALQRAIQNHPPSPRLIHHPICIEGIQQTLRGNGIIISMSRKGNCDDNTCIKFFHSVIKKELIFHEKYKTRA